LPVSEVFSTGAFDAANMIDVNANIIKIIVIVRGFPRVDSCAIKKPRPENYS